MKVISLGWGVQSFTLAAMVALGELESVDAAIHADTTHERSATYEFAAKWTPWLKEHGINIIQVLDESTARVWSGEMIPAYTKNTDTGKDGEAFRTCTQRWKIAPMRRWLQQVRNGQQIEQWLGISLDESERMTQSNVNYIINRYPLIENRMTRNDCINWLTRNNLEIPVKSACVFCPFHNNAAWRELKISGNGDWQKAVEVDEAIRKVRPPHDLFVHPSRKPLREVGENLDAQPSLFDMTSEECSGLCFV